MKDVDYDRIVADNWKKYLQSSLNDMKELFGWIWKELISDEGKQRAKKMFKYIVLASISSIAAPYAMSFVFDGVQTHNLMWIYIGLGSFGGLMLINNLWLAYKQMSHREYMQGYNLRRLNERTSQLFFAKSLGTHISEHNLLNEANIRKGYDRVFNLESVLLFEGIETLLNLIIAYGALWLIDVVAGLGATAMLLLFIIWSIFLNLRVLQVCIPIDKKWRALNRYRTERLYKVERVKNTGMEEFEADELTRRFDEVIGPDRKFWLWFIRQISIRGGITALILAGIVGYGVYQVWIGDMTLGLLYPLVAWSGLLASRLWRVGHLEHQINFAAPSILAMKEALSMPVGIHIPDNPIPLKTDGPLKIEFKNISYHYPEGDSIAEQNPDKHMDAVNNISFSIKPGEKVALIGPSGVGKTTIIRLLLRYMDPSSGLIEINGIDLKDIDLKSWIEKFGYIPQEQQVLNDTIRGNLIYAMPDKGQLLNDSQLWDLMRPLQLDFGKRLTHGLNTLVGRNGIKLSGGQAQRLMIGAAVTKNPHFLLIDEATSSLDATTEKLVQRGLENVLDGERSALIITHRLNTVRRICTKFVMLNQLNGNGGEVEVIGNNFEELAKRSSTFKKLAIDQGIKL